MNFPNANDTVSVVIAIGICRNHGVACNAPRLDPQELALSRQGIQKDTRGLHDD
ncbi:hypothetical protein CBOM_03179 [Ceraceosorus bombacis]|uniref:Uncharacterized protein n=1 Tax=Ceraceosorus bombacis TaxID=401625 RepID=A0A0P1BLG4_9BASI|nr:hypothetical protein CBOM_03179 [Ceraceosorus bombacis]